MSTKSAARILVLTCSTRPGALGPVVTQWLIDAITPRAAELGAHRPVTEVAVAGQLGLHPKSLFRPAREIGA